MPVASGIPPANSEYTGVIETLHVPSAFALFSYADGIPLSRYSAPNEQGYQLRCLANLHLAENSFETQFERYTIDLKCMVDEPMILLFQVHCQKPSELQ